VTVYFGRQLTTDRKKLQLPSSTLKKHAARSTETSHHIHQSTRRHMPECHNFTTGNFQNLTSDDIDHRSEIPAVRDFLECGNYHYQKNALLLCNYYYNTTMIWSTAVSTVTGQRAGGPNNYDLIPGQRHSYLLQRTKTTIGTHPTSN
jgi:hypothetical protein